MEHEITPLPVLPENCISPRGVSVSNSVMEHASTPGEVVTRAAVNRAAADSDLFWNRFIPQQFYQILPRAVKPIGPLFPRRQLYSRLCKPILIDRGTKKFWVERSTAKIGYMLSAKELTITHGNDQRYWRWVNRADSRFGEAAELLDVCWLDITGEIDCTLLSRDIEYRVLFVLKLGDQSRGWEARPIKFSVSTPEGQHMESEVVLMNGGGGMQVVANDGWMEVLAGQLRVTADSILISFSMSEKESNQWKSGLLIDGVRIEPMPA